MSSLTLEPLCEERLSITTSLSGLQGGSQNPLYIGLEDRLCSRPLHRQRRTHPLKSHAREQGDVSSPVSWRLKAHPLAPTRPSVDRRGIGGALLHEHEASAIQFPGHQSTPGTPQELVPFNSHPHSAFGTKPIFLSSRERVDSLTETPTISLRKRHLSLRVVAGLSTTSASRILCAGLPNWLACTNDAPGSITSQPALGLPVLPAKQGKAERVGFEPTGRLQTFHAISSRAPSANSDTSPEILPGEFTR